MEPERKPNGGALRGVRPWNSLHVFLALALVGGMLEAFTYLLHGGVFCNAQTGNLVLFLFRLVEGETAEALPHLYAVLSFAAGVCFSAFLPWVIRSGARYPVVAGAELLCFVAIFFIPDGAPDWCTYVVASFLFAVQYNTFTDCGDVTVSTTFCSNNIRQTIVLAMGGLRGHDRRKLKKSAVYGGVILAFAAGAAVGALIVRWAGKYVLFFSAVPMLFVLVCLLVRPRGGSPRGGKPSSAPSAQ